MLSLLSEYRKIPRHIFYVIVAEFFVQLVNSSFLAIQPLFMQNNGYTDAQSAGYIGYRFLGVLVLALPLGFYIRNKKIKNLFYLAGFGVPLFAMAIVYATAYHIDWMVYSSQLLWGASFTFIQIPILPFIFRTSPKETHIASITLSYSTWSFASICGGLLIGLLNHYDNKLFNEEYLLILMSAIGLAGIFFIARMVVKEELPEQTAAKLNFADHDWGRIAKVLGPTFLIAIGAGFTIPFLNLFFVNVHNMTTSEYSFIYSLSAILVAFGSMSVPFIKKRWGYHKAVPFTQSMAIVALVAMSTTQYYNHLGIAVYIAVIFFLLRQPLMNMAGPMTTDVVMGYAGPKNREMVSALTMAIWSGSWFVSSRIFEVLRELNFTYVSIFLITASLYVVGVAWYYILVKEHQRMKEI
ncbi:MAG: MFS transporter [Bacteroidetes bacterium]|nr:MFS transporter [Bacteroidota bacterium]